jgi:HlyD family secretion protein
MKRYLLWGIIVLVVAAASVAGWMWFNDRSSQRAGIMQQRGLALATNAGGAQTTADGQTVEIRPAGSVIGRVSAAGNIALTGQHYVVLKVGGAVNQVNVNVGDVVTAGTVLLSLDTTELERALHRAQLSVDASQNSLAQLQEAADPNEIAQAEAQLLAAQENLKDVQAGPSDEEIAAANATLASAWALYEERTAPMSDAERTTLEASLKTAEIALAEAQRNYDKVAWRNDVGMTAEAAALQEASIEYERLKAEYEIATAPPSQSDIQSALSSAQEAQRQLDELLAQPTAADLAAAEAEVASAQADLESVKKGATDLELQAAEIALEQALVDLEEAHTQMQQATVVAPIGVTVMQVTG